MAKCPRPHRYKRIWVTGRVTGRPQNTKTPASEDRDRRNSLLDNTLHKAGDGTRTRDLQLGKLTLYQLSYSRSHNTCDTPSPTQNQHPTPTPRLKHTGRLNAPQEPRMSSQRRAARHIWQPLRHGMPNTCSHHANPRADSPDTTRTRPSRSYSPTRAAMPHDHPQHDVGGRLPAADDDHANGRHESRSRTNRREH